MKIISLLPSATEMVYALGLEEALEGVTFECDYPPSARGKPVVSSPALPIQEDRSPSEIDRLVAERVAQGQPLYVLDEERIRNIQPDLILAQDLCRVCAVPSGQVLEALQKLGCSAEVISLDPNSLDEIIDGLGVVGRATGKLGRAEALMVELRERIEKVEALARDLPRLRTLALEWLDPPFTGGHWIPEMIAIAGGEDVLARPGERSRRATWAEIRGGAPEVVVFMPCGYDLAGATVQAECLWEVPEFRSTPAARSGRVYAVDASSYFSRPGPRIVDGLEILAWAIHSDVFPEPPGGRIQRLRHGSTAGHRTGWAR
jgi:iron complex transport system substrate-binding protein